MPLQNTGALSFSQINTEMNTGASGSISLSSFRSSGNTKARGVTGIPTSGIISFSHFKGKEAIPVVNGLIGKYTGESWNGTTLVDETGGGYDTTANRGGSINTNTSSNTSLKYISGGTTSGLQFPTTILPSTYTILFLTRYNGTNRSRIMDGITNNWLSGHWGSRSGVAYHEGWLHNDNDYYSNTWVLSTDQINLYRSNRVERSTSGGTASTRLSLHYGNFTGINYNENSDWAFYCLFVYNRELSASEILSMENYINNRYKTLIMTIYNWYTLFNRINSNFTITQTGSDPNVQLQMNSTSVGSSQTNLWYSQRIQNYSQFVADFEINISSGADGSSFNVGFNSTTGFWGEGPNTPAFCLTFHVYNLSRTPGIYLFDSEGTQVGFYNYAIGESVWRPIRVVYTRSTTNTWQIFFNNTNIINYSNPNNETWVTTTSGAVFGFGSRTGGETHNFYLRRFTLSVQD